MTKYMWKFLSKKGRSIVSVNGDQKWKIGEWVHLDGQIIPCKHGLHASKGVYQAFSYVQGDILARVEVKGEHVDEEDKSAYSDMRIVKAYKWTKGDSVSLAIFSAELCLKEFEKLYPDDKRPREAIEAAIAVLVKDTKKNREAAESAAESAWSAAESARSAAESAAWSAAESAARSAAESAAWSAAESAESAAESAWSAAESAARSAAWSAWSAARKRTLNKIEKWLVEHIDEMEKIG